MNSRKSNWEKGRVLGFGTQLTVDLAEELLELDPEEECLEDEGHDDGDDDHREDVEGHEEHPARVDPRLDRVTLHDHVPIVDH